MKSNKWPLLTISFLAIVLNNFALAEGDGGNGGDDYDGDGHNNGDDHHHHDHNHLTFGIGGYYDPWFWDGYGYYNPGFWGNYYGPGFYSPYGYRAYGHADSFFRPYYYTYPPVVTAPSRSPVYIQQQPEPKLAQPKTNYWYYCQYPQGYYPHIKECPGGWTQVAPQPQTQ